jgi:hypothetical protein
MENTAGAEKTIGFNEVVEVFGNEGYSTKVIAKIDTGAGVSSIDVGLAAELSLGPLLKTEKIKSSLGAAKRAVVKAKVTVKGKTIVSNFTISDRSRLKFPLLLGKNSLKKLGFLINPLE